MCCLVAARHAVLLPGERGRSWQGSCRSQTSRARATSVARTTLYRNSAHWPPIRDTSVRRRPPMVCGNRLLDYTRCCVTLEAQPDAGRRPRVRPGARCKTSRISSIKSHKTLDRRSGFVYNGTTARCCTIGTKQVASTPFHRIGGEVSRDVASYIGGTGGRKER